MSAKLLITQDEMYNNAFTVTNENKSTTWTMKRTMSAEKKANMLLDVAEAMGAWLYGSSPRLETAGYARLYELDRRVEAAGEGEWEQPELPFEPEALSEEQSLAELQARAANVTSSGNNWWANDSADLPLHDMGHGDPVD